MNDETRMSEPLVQALHSELKPGERIIWAGQPILGKHGKKAAILFTAIIGQGVVFALIILAMDIFRGDWISMGTISGVFILAICSYFINWAWSSVRNAKYLIYAITTDRALVMSCVHGTSVNSYSLERIVDPSRRESPDGSGDLILIKEEARTSNGHPTIVERGFFTVRDVKGVERKLHEALQRVRA